MKLAPLTLKANFNNSKHYRLFRVRQMDGNRILLFMEAAHFMITYHPYSVIIKIAEKEWHNQV